MNAMTPQSSGGQATSIRFPLFPALRYPNAQFPFGPLPGRGRISARIWAGLAQNSHSSPERAG